MSDVKKPSKNEQIESFKGQVTALIAGKSSKIETPTAIVRKFGKNVLVSGKKEK